jgi:cysteine-rich repeat protein
MRLGASWGIAAFFVVIPVLVIPASCSWFESTPISADTAEEDGVVVPDGDAEIEAPDMPDGMDIDADGDVEEDVETDDPGGCTADFECRDSNLCNGEEQCNTDTGECRPGEPLDDGFLCALEPRSICIDASCVMSTCGDGFVDTGAGEFCEPSLDPECGNDCSYACSGDEDCPDDGNVCNGDEICDPDTHQCVRGSPAADGTPCGTDPRRICLSGSCQTSLCGDGFTDPARVPPEECDDANAVSGDGCDNDCTYSCSSHADCLDHVCATGTCDPAEHTCDYAPLSSPTVCRPSAGVCDVAESCTDTSLDCPANAFAPATQTCRPAAGQCDEAERCTGSSASCPADAFKAPGTPCDDGDPDTGPDTCTAEGVCYGPPIGTGEVVAVAPGYCFTCALMSGGGVRCWGRNSDGQLGNGTTTDSLVPVPVTGLPSGVAAITAGRYHACAITSSGGVKCWGRNSSGQLGNGTDTSSPTPVDVSGLTSGVSMITASRYFTCALVSGSPRCWGANTCGQLGTGNTVSSNVPVPVTGISGGITAVSAGGDHTCALQGDGLLCWGENGNGQVGDGTTTDRYTPVGVFGLDNNVRMVAAGRLVHTCAVVDPGAAMCWGDNASGQVGNGTTTDQLTPDDVIGLSSGVTAVTTGGSHSCALVSGGAVLCWGENGDGQLGTGSTADMRTPAPVTGLGSGVASVLCGERHTCALLSSGGLMCWGDNSYGQVGDRTTSDRTTPVTVIF